MTLIPLAIGNTTLLVFLCAIHYITDPDYKAFVIYDLIMNRIANFFMFISMNLLIAFDKNDYKKKSILRTCIRFGTFRWLFSITQDFQTKYWWLHSISTKFMFSFYLTIFVITTLMNKLSNRYITKEFDAGFKQELSYFNSCLSKYQLIWILLLIYYELIGVKQGLNIFSVFVDAIGTYLQSISISNIKFEHDFNKKEMLQTLKFHLSIESAPESLSDDFSEEEIDKYLEERRRLARLKNLNNHRVTFQTEQVFDIRPNSELEVISKETKSRCIQGTVRYDTWHRFNSFGKKLLFFAYKQQTKYNTSYQVIYTYNPGNFIWDPLNNDQLLKDITFIRCVPFLYEANIGLKHLKKTNKIDFVASQMETASIHKKKFNFLKDSLTEVDDNAFLALNIPKITFPSDILFEVPLINTIGHQTLIADQIRGRLRLTYT